MTAGAPPASARGAWVLGVVGAALLVLRHLSLALLAEPVGLALLSVAGPAFVGMGVQWGLAAAESEAAPLWRLAWLGHYALAGVALLWWVADIFLPLALTGPLAAAAPGALAYGLFRLGRRREDPLLLLAAAGQVLVALPGPGWSAVRLGVDGPAVALLVAWMPLVYGGCAVLLGLAFVRSERGAADPLRA